MSITTEQPTEAALTPKEYAIERGGAVCPVCESDDIVADNLHMDGIQAWIEITCNACYSTWDDVYNLVYYDNLEIGG